MAPSAIDIESSLTLPNGVENWMTSAIVSIASVIFLMVLAICACCKDDQPNRSWGSAPYLPAKKRPKNIEVPKAIEDAVDLEKQPTVDADVTAQETLAPAVTAVQMTVIAADPHASPKTALSSPKLNRKVPEDAVRYDDPDYRTIGKDMDKEDPFFSSKSKSVGPTRCDRKSTKRNRALPPKKYVPPKRKKAKSVSPLSLQSVSVKS